MTHLRMNYSSIGFSKSLKLSDSGFQLVAEGTTSLDEVLRVTSEK